MPGASPCSRTIPASGHHPVPRRRRSQALPRGEPRIIPGLEGHVHVDFHLVSDDDLRQSRWVGADRSAHPARLEGQSLGTGREPGAASGGDPADPDDPPDEAVGPVGQGRAPRRRHPLPPGRRAAALRPLPVQPVHRQRQRQPLLTYRDRVHRGRRSPSSTTPRRPACDGSRSRSGSSTTPGRSASSGSGRSWRRTRPRPSASAATPIERQVPFDYELSLDDRAFYCVEMTEKAYRSSGLPLSEPVRLGDMENMSKYPVCVFVFLQISDLKLDQFVLLPWQRASRDLVVAEPGDGLSVSRPCRPAATAARRRQKHVRTRGGPEVGVRGTNPKPVESSELDFRRDSGKLTLRIRPTDRSDRPLSSRVPPAMPRLPRIGSLCLAIVLAAPATDVAVRADDGPMPRPDGERRLSPQVREAPGIRPRGQVVLAVRAGRPTPEVAPVVVFHHGWLAVNPAPMAPGSITWSAAAGS